MQTFQQLADDLNLSPILKRTIARMGYETPSPIQAEALPILLGEPVDFVGLAATGTGKTAAFTLPLLERIARTPQSRELPIQALILCPTRELALQVSGQVDLLGQELGVKSVAIYGGADYGPQIRGLRSGASVVVGTPGRVIDHLTKGTLSLEGLQTLILDEADEMISMGFKDDLETILSSRPTEGGNVWLFSATMSREVRKVADTYLHEPAVVQINRAEMLPTTIEQIYFATAESNKPDVIRKLIDAADEFYGLIFCQTKALVIDLTSFLKSHGYKVDCLHGDMDQNARERTMQAYRDRRVTVLICTDVASRGLDVKDVTHVVNYSIPRELDNYVHRIGRTGRSGKTGLAYSLVTPSHRALLGRIERMTRTQIKEGKIPNRRDIAAKKIERSLPKFTEQPEAAIQRATDLLSPEWKAALATMTGEEIAARFLTLLYADTFVDAPAAAPAVRVNPGQQPRGGYSDRSYGAPRGDRRGPREYGDRPERSDRPNRYGARQEDQGHDAADDMIRIERIQPPAASRFGKQRTAEAGPARTGVVRPNAPVEKRPAIIAPAKAPAAAAQGAPNSPWNKPLTKSFAKNPKARALQNA
jgi:ATP-dependent RNA helicase DeaD